ncbi:hypothetical protein N7540_006007 [Penicillium herquei]|nr:hypothetical protein N7540_006007 [Penicillium herquei]
MQRSDVQRFLLELNCHNVERGELEKILRILWDQSLLCGDSPDLSNTLDEELLQYIMTLQPDSALETLGIFLDWRPEIRVPITNEFIFRTIVKGRASKECFQLLFRRCDIQVPIILERTIRARLDDPFDGDYHHGFAYLAEEWPNELQICEPLIARFVWSESPKLFESLSKNRREVIRVTQKTLEMAVLNSKYPNTLLFLWPYREPDTMVTQSMVETAAALRTIHSEKLLRFLLEQLISHSTLDTMALVSCLQTCTDGIFILRLLLEYTSSSLWKSEVLVYVICTHTDAPSMLMLLGKIDGFSFPITENILCAAAKNSNGHWMVHWLAQMHQGPLPVTETVLLSAIQNLETGSKVLEILMQNIPSTLWTDALFEAACRNKKAMVFLLDQHPKILPIGKMIEALKFSQVRQDSTDIQRSRDVLQILLQRDILKVDEKLIETLALSPTLLVCMLLFNPDVKITHKALLCAASNFRSMRLILEARGNSLPITEDVLIAAIEARSDREMFDLLLSKQGSLPLTNKVLDKALEFQPAGACLFQVLPDSDVRKIWQPSWRDTQAPMEDRVENLIRVLKIQGSRMTDQMLEKFPYDPENRENYGFDDFIEMLCTEEDPPALLPGTERAAELILERCGNRAIQIFVQCENYPYSVTENSIQAAGRNEIADRGKLISFLEQKRSQSID